MHYLVDHNPLLHVREPGCYVYLCLPAMPPLKCNDGDGSTD